MLITDTHDRHPSGMPCRHPSGVLGPCDTPLTCQCDYLPAVDPANGMPWLSFPVGTIFEADPNPARPDNRDGIKGYRLRERQHDFAYIHPSSHAKVAAPDYPGQADPWEPHVRGVPPTMNWPDVLFERYGLTPYRYRDANANAGVCVGFDGDRLGTTGFVVHPAAVGDPTTGAIDYANTKIMPPNDLCRPGDPGVPVAPNGLPVFRNDWWNNYPHTPGDPQGRVLSDAAPPPSPGPVLIDVNAFRFALFQLRDLGEGCADPFDFRGPGGTPRYWTLWRLLRSFNANGPTSWAQFLRTVLNYAGAGLPGSVTPLKDDCIALLLQRLANADDPNEYLMDGRTTAYARPRSRPFPPPLRYYTDGPSTFSNVPDAAAGTYWRYRMRPQMWHRLYVFPCTRMIRQSGLTGPDAEFNGRWAFDMDWDCAISLTTLGDEPYYTDDGPDLGCGAQRNGDRTRRRMRRGGYHARGYDGLTLRCDVQQNSYHKYAAPASCERLTYTNAYAEHTYGPRRHAAHGPFYDRWRFRPSCWREGTIGNYVQRAAAPGPRPNAVTLDFEPYHWKLLPNGNSTPLAGPVASPQYMAHIGGYNPQPLPYWMRLSVGERHLLAMIWDTSHTNLGDLVIPNTDATGYFVLLLYVCHFKKWALTDPCASIDIKQMWITTPGLGDGPS